MTSYTTLENTLKELPSHTEKAIRARSLDLMFRRNLDEAEDCGFAVNRGGWWNRTPKGDEYLESQRYLYKRCTSCGVHTRTNRTECWMCDGGKLVLDEGCQSAIHHGPGHQSTTRCEAEGEHDVHYATYGSAGQYARWTGDDVSSGYFDEPPEDDGKELVD